MSDRAIVCYVDILGFDSIVSKKIKDMNFIKNLDESIYKMTVNLLTRFTNNINKLTNDPAEQDYLRKISNSTTLRFIFDNIIISLPIPDIKFNSREFDNDTNISNYLDYCFRLMATSSLLFIQHTGYVLRGGISLGSHYESEQKNYLFIFSEAHNNAVALEKKAKDPRILLEDKLQLFLKEISYANFDKYFYKEDKDSCYCFDIYSILHDMCDKRVDDALREIKENLTLNMESNSNNEKALGKLIYFAEYHNNKVKRNCLDHPEKMININKFKK